MEVKDALSKERFINGLKNLGKLRVRVSHSAIMTFTALLLILFLSFTVRLFPIRWEIDPTGGKSRLVLSEFDPYFQFRFAEKMLRDGFISWALENGGVGWIDWQRWYPNGFPVAKAGFPGLPMTAAFLYKIVSLLGVNIDLMSFCALLPPIMGMLASLAIYFLGKDMGGKAVGLFAALFLALSPSYIQRTSLGFFDDEIIGILALIVFVFTFLRAIEESRPINSTVKYSLGAGFTLAYFCSGWGAAYYPIGLTVLFIFVLVLLKRYTQRLLLVYSLTFGLGLFIAINVPKLTPNYLVETAILPVAAMFVLLCFLEILRVLTSTRSKVIFTIVLMAILTIGFSVLWSYRQDIAGKFISVLNPITRAGEPLIESVAEHRISTWGSIYYEFGIGIIFFIVGLYFVSRNLDIRNLFLLIFGLTSLYFACSMVRLFVLMAPAFALVSATGAVGMLKPFNMLLKEPPKISIKKYGLEHVGKEFSGTAIFLIFIVLMTNFAFPSPRVYRQAYVPITITGGSLPIAPNKPVSEWLDMLEWVSINLEATDIVVSWWDYGYWLTVLGNVTTLADNATINTTQIENIGFVFMANETEALKMLELYNPQRTKYILIFTTLYTWADANTGQNYAQLAGYGDEGKWMWMARISGKGYDRFRSMGFSPDWKNETTFGKWNETLNRWMWNERGLNSTIYKLMSWAEQRWCTSNGALVAFETIREPQYFKEMFFAGLGLKPENARSDYGGYVPLVCLYKIDWDKYYSTQ
ncbi:MAG: STT3 domain-containing protein [Candidatus Bathyarchaeia archaeon]